MTSASTKPVPPGLPVEVWRKASKEKRHVFLTSMEEWMRDWKSFVHGDTAALADAALAILRAAEPCAACNGLQVVRCSLHGPTCNGWQPCPECKR